MKTSFPLFRRFGVELEYMIVDAKTLAIRPESDFWLQRVSGNLEGDFSRGALEWSNELALHVIEFKTGKPAKQLDGLELAFQGEVRFFNELLKSAGACLMPSAMHPWMSPERESRLWPHTNREIYAAFDRIFNCSGHGWTNLQSCHLNLPFSNDSEFGALHTGIRLILPLIPALAASSPYREGRFSGFLDTRLDVYRGNCRRIPSVTGRVIPEPVMTPAAYEKRILRRIYRDLAPHDPEGVLRYEWANARGAIARFDRNTIEIRVLDLQECPRMDMAILQAIVAVLRGFVAGKFSALQEQASVPTLVLERALKQCGRLGRFAKFRHPGYLAALGMPGRPGVYARDIWERLLSGADPQEAWLRDASRILTEGSLAERLLGAAGNEPSPERLRLVYRKLADCLEQGIFFDVGH